MSEAEYLQARQRMLEEQIIAHGIREQRLLSAIMRVPRHRFVPAVDFDSAYSDCPLAIGHGQTISQPFIVALMTDLLKLSGDEKILEVGTGSGYQAAVLGEMARKVHTVEVIPELAVQAASILAELEYSNVIVHAGDGSKGWPQAGPYDGILVAAAAPQVPPPLLAQLAQGGRLVIPVGAHTAEYLELWRREGQNYTKEVSLQVEFVLCEGFMAGNRVAPC